MSEWGGFSTLGAMPQADAMILGLVQVLACAVPACGLALLLRGARCPGGRAGAAMVGGLVVGLLLGPGVMGRVTPRWQEPVFRGGVSEAAALREEIERQRVERRALQESGVTDVALEEHDRVVMAPKRAELQQGLDRALAEHRAGLQLIQAVLCGVLVMLGVPSACARSGRLWRRTGERGIDTRWRDAGRGALGTVLAASIPGALAWWLLRDVKLAVGVAAALSVPGLVMLPCGLFIGCASGAGLAASAAMVGLWTVPATIVGVMAFVGLALCVGSERSGRASRRGERELGAAYTFVLPALVALGVVMIDPRGVVVTGAFIWLGVLAVLWSSDGRWLAWYLAGHRWTRAGQVVSAGASVGQLVVALACGWAGAADGVVAALIVGCVVIELTSGVRSSLARQMDGPADEG